ncbi:MAG: NYN domain-containing protein [Isosphaeraceae bacterium]
MLWLIDGYNLMHAIIGPEGKRLPPSAFRLQRRRFLNFLADCLGADRARQTTVVLDAKSPPADFDLEANYKGLTLIFALGDENADARIEMLIAGHSVPRSLTVVSSDHRVRRAATRRKAHCLTSDQFLDLLDRFRNERRRQKAAGSPEANSVPARPATSSADDSAYWLDQFRELEDAPEVRELEVRDSTLLTDEEIARIQREVDGEG